MDSPTQPYIPASEALLTDWCGPVGWHDGDQWHRDTFGLDSGPGRLRSYGVARFHLDARRREVQHLICDRINLPAWQGRSEWCAALTWWAGTTARPLWAMLCPWQSFHNPRCEVFYRTSLPADMAGIRVADDDGWMCRYGVGNDYMVHGRETRDAGKAAADTAALAHDCALLNIVDGVETLTLPPITPGGSPVIWSPPCLPK